MARYGAEGIPTVLVTCTGGEAGDIRPAADSDERADLAAVRRRARRAMRIIGYGTLHMLGYRDSGMAAPNQVRTRTASPTDLDQAVGRLVAIVRNDPR
jgi:LmbE family N-acetylglucosaminyl deacetylase